jgi:hypothetical protein
MVDAVRPPAMNVRRMAWIGVVWVGCAAAWLVLGASLVVRSEEMSSGALLGAVQALWGPPLEQHSPTALYRETRTETETTVTRDPTGREFRSTRVVEKERVNPLPLDATEALVVLDLEHRRKGLLWFATYGVAFEGRYAFSNRTGVARTLEVAFALPARQATYDGFEVLDSDGKRLAVKIASGTATWSAPLAPGATHTATVRYRSRGTSRWSYRPSEDDQVRNFRLQARTNFAGVDFPPGSISPSHQQIRRRSWEGTWEFGNLLSAAPISIACPEKINPGPLAARVTFFAPIGLLFYFFVVALLAEVRRVRLEPFHYFLIGCGFFAFHLLFAYLADHLTLAETLALSSVASLALVVTYARLFVGWRFALREMGIAQLVYLVGFSLSFLLEGYTGLAITVGAIVTLCVMMQVTGRAFSTRTPPGFPLGGPRGGETAKLLPPMGGTAQ